MAYHIVNIDTANCSLSCRDGQLICKTSDGERKLPLEDVACIVVTSFSASIHSHLLIEAAKHGVGLVLCKAFKPVSILMPANRSTDTILSRAVLELAPRVRQNLWQKTVDAKCQNQFALAAHIAPTDTQLELLNSKPSAKSRTKKPLAPGRSGISTHVR
jgi:CRISPR/Cas system-associated endonuclease Cas1